MPPTRANGKICSIEMPATDVQKSAEFYHGEIQGAGRERDRAVPGTQSRRLNSGAEWEGSRRVQSTWDVGSAAKVA